MAFSPYLVSSTNWWRWTIKREKTNFVRLCQSSSYGVRNIVDRAIRHDVYSRILGQLSQPQQVFRNSLWAFRPLRIRSVPDDVILKAPIQADAGRVQGSRYTEDGWQIRSEASFEGGGRSEQRGGYIFELHLMARVLGQLGIRGISLEGRQLPVL